MGYDQVRGLILEACASNLPFQEQPGVQNFITRATDEV
jgi:hypothetical protein